MPAETLSPEAIPPQEIAEVIEPLHLEAAPEQPAEEVEAEATPEQPSSRPTGEALGRFTDEILGGPLPPEIASKVAELKQAKNEESHFQLEKTTELATELQTGLLGRWIEKGHLTTPSVVETNQSELIASLEQALQDYEQSEAGQQDVLIKSLRDFLGNSGPNKEQLLALADKTDTPASQLKLRLMPGYKDKLESELRLAAERKLNLLAPPGKDFDDKELSWQDQIQSEGGLDADIEVSRVVDESSSELKAALAKFRDTYQGSSYDSSRLPKGDRVGRLKQEISILDETQHEWSGKLVEAIGKPEKLLSSMARGSISPEGAIELLKAREGKSLQPEVDLTGVFRSHIEKEWRSALDRLPEPSLVGLSYTEEDLQLVEKSLDGLSSLAEISGVHLRWQEQDRINMLKDIQRTQELFFEKIDSPNSLYWHFTAKGLDILSSGEMQSGDLVEERNTGEFSKGVHFIKPGFGMESGIQYHLYAKGVRSNAGLAMIYKLDDIMDSTPVRDEPLTETFRGKASVSEDVTFRTAEDSSEYTYPLEKAYILPFATWEQLSLLRGDAELASILDQPQGTPLYKVARDVAVKTLKDAGQSDEWIEEHLLHAERLVDPEILGPHSFRRDLETPLFGNVTHEITKGLPSDRRIVVPLAAKKGSVEAHDRVGGVGPDLWQEELIELRIA